jgi:hypothetical protein
MVEKLKLTSASGLLALLEEEQNALKAHALKSLITVVDDHWAEVAGSISLRCFCSHARKVHAFQPYSAHTQSTLNVILFMFSL